MKREVLRCFLKTASDGASMMLCISVFHICEAATELLKDQCIGQQAMVMKWSGDDVHVSPMNPLPCDNSIQQNARCYVYCVLQTCQCR